MDGRLDSQWWFPSEQHEEAVARCLHLLERRCGCGVMAGGRGAGKSLLLKRVEQAARRQRMLVCRIDLEGLGPDEFAWELCAGLRLNPDPRGGAIAWWRQTADFLLGAAAGSCSPVVLLDHLEGAGFVRELRRWLACAAEQSVVTIAAVDLSRAPRDLLVLLGDFCELRADLPPLSPEQCERFAEGWIRRRRNPEAPKWVSAGARTLQGLTGGVPRKLERLCRLAELAEAAEQGRPLDRAALEALLDELTLDASSGRGGVVPGA